jgi:hypothetical protein
MWAAKYSQQHSQQQQQLLLDPLLLDQRNVAELKKLGLKWLHILISHLIFAPFDLMQKPRGGYQFKHEKSA